MFCDVVITSAESPSADHTVDQMVDFVKLRVAELSSAALVRGPLLAQLELMRMLKERSDERWDKIFGKFSSIVFFSLSQLDLKLHTFVFARLQHWLKILVLSFEWLEDQTLNLMQRHL